MKLFERSGGHWLFWWSVLYFIAGMLNMFVFNDQDWFPGLQIAWLALIALPLTYNPLGRWLNMKENRMFDWFNKDKTVDNVLPFPGKQNPYTPYIAPPEPKPKEPEIHYKIGHTNDNRISFIMGYTTLTMNKQGCEDLIAQLELFKNQLQEVTDE